MFPLSPEASPHKPSSYSLFQTAQYPSTQIYLNFLSASPLKNEFYQNNGTSVLLFMGVKKDDFEGFDV